MPVTMTTKSTGGTALLMTPVSVTEPEIAMTPERLGAFLDGSGLNGPFVADQLSAMLAHEQCGFHLYQTVAGLTKNPMLKGRYTEFGAQTKEHIGILEELITRLGGDPGYVSPTARLVHAMDDKMLEATTMLSGAADENTCEQAMLDAVMLAETKDHANWRMLAQLTEQLPDGDAKQAFTEACSRVEPQEDDHIGWATSTMEKLFMVQARSPMAQKGMKAAEKAVGKVKDVLS